MVESVYETRKKKGIATMSAKFKQVSDNQGREIARLWRKDDVPAKKVQEVMFTTIRSVGQAIRDGRPITIGPMPTNVIYPDWVKERLTPELEVTEVSDPGKVELWLDPRQKTNSLPTGHQVYEAHGEERLKKALSLGHLQWYAEDRSRIPKDWVEQGLWVYGFASVVQHATGLRRVPCLVCRASPPYVSWDCLDGLWLVYMRAGVRAS